MAVFWWSGTCSVRVWLWCEFVDVGVGVGVGLGPVLAGWVCLVCGCG